MKTSKFFPSKYLKATVDLDEGQQKLVTISGAKTEEFDGEEKIVCFFEEFDKGLVMNRTNTDIINKIAKTDDTDDWPGVQVILYQKETTMGTGFGMKEPKPGAAVAKPKPASTSATDLDTVKRQAWAALKLKYATVADDAELKKILLGHIDEFFEGQTPATLGAKQWQQLIDNNFDADRLAMAGGAVDDIPF